MSKFEILSINGSLRLPEGSMEERYFHQFYICEKTAIKEIIFPVFLFFIKTDDISNPSTYVYLHAQYIESPKNQLKDFENSYFDECTHVLWYSYGDENTDMEEETSKIILQRITTNPKVMDFYKWVYPIKNPYEF